ncbi:MAG: hypothetical protein SFZ02_21770 [bacterium]|nr:hypothetical protein [bacterium]
MDFVTIFLILLVISGAGILFFKLKNNASRKVDDSPRDHETVYEMPQLRMTDEGELTDSFIVQMKTLKKYRDELVNDENQE